MLNSNQSKEEVSNLKEPIQSSLPLASANLQKFPELNVEQLQDVNKDPFRGHQLPGDVESLLLLVGRQVLGRDTLGLGDTGPTDLGGLVAGGAVAVRLRIEAASGVFLLGTVVSRLKPLTQ